MLFKKRKMIQLLKQIKKENSGATLSNYKPIKHPFGYQYSVTENTEENATADIYKAYEMIQALKGNCGIWYDGGLFYVEESYHTDSFNDAMRLACEHNQKTIYDWRHDRYIECDPNMTYLKYTNGIIS
jgi:hypothetical protein